jgi:hypothetical protein
MAHWTHVGTTTAGDSAATTLAYTRPAGVIPGDLLVLHFYLESQAKTPSVSNGTWTQIGTSLENTDTGNGVSFEHWVYYQRVTSETGGITVSWDGTSLWRGGVLSAYRGGLESGDPNDVTPATNVSGSGTTSLTVGGVTTATDDALLVASAAIAQGSNRYTWTGVTERADFGGIGAGDAVRATAGATGAVTASLNFTSFYTAKLWAFKPGATPDYVGAGTAAFTATNGATLSPGLPTGWAAGDIHVLLAARSDNTAMTSLSPDWINLSAANNTAGQRVEVWVRRAVGGDAAPTVTFGSGTVVRGARIFGIRGVDPALDLSTLQLSRSDNAASATLTFATLTPTPAKTRLLALYAYEDDPSAASTITDWSAFDVSASALGTDMTLGAATRSWPSASSATGALTSTASGGSFTNSPNVGILLALPPASTGPTGTGALTIPAPVLAASGTFSTTGTGALGIAAPVLAGSGTAFGPPISGTGDTTIGAPSLAGTGSFAVTGTGAVAIGAPALAGSGTFAIGGTGALAIAAPALDGTGTFATTGTGGVAIAAPALAGSGTFTPEAITGTAALAIPAPALAGSGAFGVEGSGALTIGAPVISGSGTFTPGEVGGTGAVSIAAPALGGTGTFATTGGGAVSIDGPAIAASGTFATTGSGDLAIGGPALAGSGTVADPGTGSGAVAIDGPTLAASGTFTPGEITGTGDTTIAPPALAGSGEVAGAATGTGAVAIATPVVSGAGTFATTGSGAVSIAAPVISGSGSFLVLISGTGSVTILGPSLAGASVLATRAAASDAAYGTATASDAATAGAAAGDLALVGAVAGDSEA